MTLPITLAALFIIIFVIHMMRQQQKTHADYQLENRIKASDLLWKKKEKLKKLHRKQFRAKKKLLNRNKEMNIHV